MILPASDSASKLPRLARLGARRMTRAHVALADRPQVRVDAAAAVRAIEASLSEQLGLTVTVKTRLLAAAVRPERSLARTSAYALLEVSALGVHGVLEVEPAFLIGVLDGLCGSAPRRGPASSLTRIETVAFGYLCATALSACRAAPLLDAQFAPRLISVHDRREDFLSRLSPERHLCLEAQVALGELVGRIRLLLPATAVQAGIQELAPERPSTFETVVSTVGVQFRARMGRAQLTARELLDLGRGDVVLLDGMALANQSVTGAIRLTGTAAELAGEVTPEGLQLSRVVVRKPVTELPMKTQDEATCMLPIELEVELARVQIPVGELAAIRPGAVVPLRINPSDAVTIRIGDRAIARAELVDIDGEVGARILSLVA